MNSTHSIFAAGESTTSRLLILSIVLLALTAKPVNSQETTPRLQPVTSQAQLRPAPNVAARSATEDTASLMQRMRQLANRSSANHAVRDGATRPLETMIATSNTVAPTSFEADAVEDTSEAVAAASQDQTTAKQPAFLDLTQTSENAQIADATQTSDSDLMVRFAIWTVIITCCCGLTALGVRYWQRSKGILPALNSQSRVLETVALGSHRTISLIQLRDVRAVVGCDGTGVCSIVIAPEPFDQTLAETDQTYEAA